MHEPQQGEKKEEEWTYIPFIVCNLTSTVERNVCDLIFAFQLHLFHLYQPDI